MDSAPQEPLQTSPKDLAALTRRVYALERQVAELKLQFLAPSSSSSLTPPLSFRSGAEEPASPISATEPIPPPPLPPLSFRSKAEGSAVVLPHQAPPPPKQSLENRLGSQIFNRIGVIALLIGTSLVLKLAIDQGWIGPIGRVIAGLIAGAALVLWSERFRRKNFAAFSYSLKAVGTGVLYLTLWAAFHLYHLLPAPIALVAMIGVTVWNAFMAFTQDSELLAAFALSGAFATPLLLSTGGDHEIFLFTYILAIDLATAILLIYKPWPRLILGYFPSTVLFFIGWYAQYFDRAPILDRPLAITAAFLTAFFAAFTLPTLTTPLLSSRSAKTLSSRSEAEGSASPIPASAPRPATTPSAYALIPLALILANAAFLSLGLYSVLEDTGNHSLLPWLMVAMAALSLALMQFQRTAAAAGLQLSLAVTFLTIAIPLKATGRWITIGWLAEGVALLWTASRLSAPLAARDYPDQSPIAPYRMIRLLASAALVLGFLGAVSLPFWLYPNHLIDEALLNTRFATSLVAIAAFAIAAYIAHAAASNSSPAPDLLSSRSAPLLSSRSNAEGSAVALPHPAYDPLWPTIAIASILALNLVALQSGINEIQTFWNGTHPQPDAALQTALSISAFLMAYGAALLAIGFWRRTAFIRWQGLVLLVIAISKTFLYDVRNLSQGYRVASFMGLGVLLMAVSFAYQKDWLSLRELPPEELPTTNPEAGQ